MISSPHPRIIESANGLFVAEDRIDGPCYVWPNGHEAYSDPTNNCNYIIDPRGELEVRIKMSVWKKRIKTKVTGILERIGRNHETS